MAGQKYLTRKPGQTALQEVSADQVGGSAASAGNIPALDANGMLAQGMMPVGVGPDISRLPASEALAAGAFVDVYALSGAPTVRNADGSVQGKDADGFVLAAVASGATAVVFFNGKNNALSGLTPGVDYWLSASAPGGVTATDPTGSGQTSQYLGMAVSATEINFTKRPAVALA